MIAPLLPTNVQSNANYAVGAKRVDLEPTTRPTGSKPASVTRRNSFTERSLVNKPFFPPAVLILLNRSRAWTGKPSSDPGTYGADNCYLLSEETL